jgi:hypothetical protein
VDDEEIGLHREKQIRNWRAIVNLGTPFKLKDNDNAESAWCYCENILLSP